MIIVLNHDITSQDKKHLISFLHKKGFQIREIVGENDTILGAVGQLRIDIREVELFSGVDRVIPISKPYKLASRELKKEDTIVTIGKVKIGGLRVVAIAGPCAVESHEQMVTVAQLVRSAGAVMLRGGAFKPRTSPYSFQGLEEKGLVILKEAGEKVGLPVSSEIISTSHLSMMNEYIDVFQIGARNMQNFDLLKGVGKIGKPVILKRGLSATIEEWLMSAEYLMAHGTDNIILCERGIRTFETYTRNTLDLSAIPVIKKLSHLPIIVDPSHGTGMREKVSPMALAAVAAGADGIMIEVHHDPDKALSDGPQSLYPAQFERLMRDIQALSPVIGKELEKLPEQPQPVSLSGKTHKKKSIKNQESISVSFQGVRGAFSEQAIKLYFTDEVKYCECSSFKDVFENVLTGKSIYGIIPLENSLAGSIYENIDLLQRYPDLTILGEQKIRIIHSLLTLKNTSIASLKKIYSHPQALAQCEDFFAHNPHIKKIPFYDTAGAAAYIAEQQDPKLGAIAGSAAAALYGLEILKEGIESNPLNYTRFLIITRTENATLDKPNRMAMTFATPDTPGALYNCLKVLAEHGLNLKKLESRPISGKPWQYTFFIALELKPEHLSEQHQIKPAVSSNNEFKPELKPKDEAEKPWLTAFKQIAIDVRVLGCYYSND